MSSTTNEGQRGGAIPIPKSKFGLKGFYTEVLREMKKVNWPDRSETNRLTGVVLAICLLLVLTLAGLSIVFDTVVKLITQGHV
ncbi:MAG: preprotein translocase subunit SecE [Fimbriimonas sp.]